MSFNSFLNKILNENSEDDDYFAVVEVYDDGEECPDEDWDEKIHAKTESMHRVRVIRNGVPVFIARSTKPGYKIAHGEERKMSLSERRAREKAAARTYIRKKKHQSDKLQAARKASIAKRKDFGLDTDYEEE